MNFQFKPEPWTEFANCREVIEPDIFFPKRNHSMAYALRKPLQICATCKVKSECLDYGQRMKATGIWGGKYLTGNERISKA